MFRKYKPRINDRFDTSLFDDYPDSIGLPKEPPDHDVFASFRSNNVKLDTTPSIQKIMIPGFLDEKEKKIVYQEKNVTTPYVKNTTI